MTVNFEHADDDELAEENEVLKRELRILGRDPAVFDDLLPDEMNLRLTKALRFAEEAHEARLLGTEPPPSFLDPLSPDWIPDVDDMVYRTARQLLGDDFPLLAESALSDDQVAEQVHRVLDRLAEKGVGFAINECVPERIAYRYLLEELSEGIAVMPGWVLDGCSGDCEGCFQLPYCSSGKDLAKEYGIHVPPPPAPPRSVDRKAGRGSARRYERHPAFRSPTQRDDSVGDADFGADDVPF
jgi:hypothetical protein